MILQEIPHLWYFLIDGVITFIIAKNYLRIVNYICIFAKKKLSVMKDLPRGIQSFKKLRSGDYLYADKTE
jgi:hypothetical protein